MKKHQRHRRHSRSQPWVTLLRVTYPLDFIVPNGAFCVCRICIIAHEPLASALKSCARHIFSATGDTFCDSIAVFDVPCDVDAEQGEAEARRLISNFPADQGVLVFTDVLGATPSNIAHRLLDNPQVRVITGVNLPALITALSHHEECAARIAVIAEGAARGGISTSCGKPSAIKDTANAD